MSANLRSYAPHSRPAWRPDEPFGLGLRLSAVEAQELLAGADSAEFRQYLASEGLYVALLNGYPYSGFHGAAVKAKVFAPDWRRRAKTSLHAGLGTNPVTATAGRHGWRHFDDAAGLQAVGNE